MLVSVVIGRASTILQDATGVRWPEAELVGWLNDGQREVVQVRHDASVSNGAITLTANSTKQTLPAGSIALLGISRNLGANGLTPGAPIKLTKREYLDALVPTWHTDVGQTAIKNYCYDITDPKRYYVYPRPHATTVVQVDALLCVLPSDCALPSVTPTAAITLADEYVNSLVDYILYRAFSKDTEAASAQRASGHYTLFMTSLGVKTKSDVATNPNTTTGAPA